MLLSDGMNPLQQQSCWDSDQHLVLREIPILYNFFCTQLVSVLMPVGFVKLWLGCEMEGKIYEQYEVENLYYTACQEQKWSQQFEINVGSYNFIKLNFSMKIQC